MNVVQTKEIGQQNILSINGKFLTTDEVCKELGAKQATGDRIPITEGRVRALVRAGKLTAQKFGKVNAFDAEEVARLQAERDAMEKSDEGKLIGGRPRREK
jgi:hypothetical protein